MKTIRSSLILFALAAGAAWAAPEIGQPAPAFSAVDSHGNNVALEDFRGQHVVLEWTNHECPFVEKHYGADNMQALQKSATGRDVVWLSIISSAPGKQGHVSGKKANELTRERGAHPSHVLFDESGDIGRAYGAKTTPHMYLIDPAGVLRYAGGIDSIPSADPADIPKATPYVELAVNNALAGEPIDPATSRPYGCSVKY